MDGNYSTLNKVSNVENVFIVEFNLAFIYSNILVFNINYFNIKSISVFMSIKLKDEKLLT